MEIKPKNSNRGNAQIYLVLLAVIVLGVMLTGGFVSPVKNKPQYTNGNSKEYLPVIPATEKGKTTLQLKKIEFIEPTSPPPRIG